MISARPTRADGRETIDRLLQFAEVELREYGPVQFRLGRVLEKSGISKSSAYHHFGNRDGIVAAVEAKLVAADVNHANLLTRAFVESAPDVASAVGYLRNLVDFTSDNSGVQARRRRAATVVAAQNSKALADIIGNTQHDGAVFLAGTFQIVADRGWISPRVPLLGIAHWMLSSVFGRVLVDYVHEEEASTLWADAMFESLISLLQPTI